MLDFELFCQDFNISIAHENHKHSREGWMNVECPRCSGNPGYHLGHSLHEGNFVCWRCGFMPQLEAIQRLSNTSWREAKQILRKYGGSAKQKRVRNARVEEKDIDVEFPKGTVPLRKPHRKYLEKRNFDSDRIEYIWGIKSTKRMTGFYGDRIVAPIYYNNRLISYQCRATDDNAEQKYLACPARGERRPHKTVLYGYDMSATGTVVVVEGVTDVWRLGPGAVATFGVKYKAEQVLLLSKFKRVFILFDETDSQAIKQGQKLAIDLGLMGVHAEQVWTQTDCDPGELSDDDSKYLMRELLI